MNRVNESIRCVIDGTRIWQNPKHLEKNRQFIGNCFTFRGHLYLVYSTLELLSKVGLLKEDPTIVPSDNLQEDPVEVLNQDGNNANEEPNPERNHEEGQPTTEVNLRNWEYSLSIDKNKFQKE